MWHHA
ncbi:rCG58312, partial [Rattus norvegicus]